MNYGRYEVTRELGTGSMGVVYEARDPQIGRTVAVKVLRADRAGNEAIVKRFLREAKAIGRLSHPHIVTIYDAGEDAGGVFIAMELVEGRSLREVIDERRLTVEEAVELGAQVAETLHYAHGKGVVHRDVKPSNILLQPDGRIKITDFGIARIQDSTDTLQTQAGTMMGTPAYMSPEQVMGAAVDGRSDLFSLGVVLYELFTGRRPFGGERGTLTATLTEIVHGEPAPLPAKGPDAVPPGLATVVLRCLRKAPEERYATGAEVAAALRAALAAAPKPKAPKAAEPAAGQEAHGRRSGLAPVLAGAAVLAVLAGGIAVYRSWTGKPPAPPVPVAPPAKPAPAPEARPPAAAPAAEPSAPPAPPPTPAPRPAEKASRPERPRPREKPAEKAARPAPGPSAPAAASTALKVLSKPDGAAVFLDGRPVGRAPATFMVTLGKHRLRASHAGYRDAETEVEVRETMEYPVRLLLEPAE